MIQNIVQELMKKLNLTEEQAKGGLGLLLKFCQEKLDKQNFSKITELVGHNWQELIKSAPDASAVMGKLSGFASVFGEKAAQLGSMASFASGFKKLNIDITKIQQFIDVTLDTLQEKGGPHVKELIQKYLKK